tara:strand:- start:114 stop:464 length:351 start_codon:yes stop_codon:yes gene_type:complete
MRDQFARETLTALQSGDHLELVYEEGKPWFWKVLVSDSVRPAEAPKLTQRPGMKRVQRKQTLDLSDPITSRVAEHNMAVELNSKDVKDEVSVVLAGLKKETPPPETNNQFASLSSN